METNIATALARGSAEDATRQLVEVIGQKLGDSPPVFVAAFASTQQDLAAVTRGLGAAFPGAVVLGTSTAGEFTEQGDAKGSVSVFALAGDYRVHAGMGEGLGADVGLAVQTALGAIPTSVDGYSHKTGILVLDPLAGVSEEATLLAASALGHDTPLAGGAAGDDLKMTQTLVGLGDRVASDALVAVVLFSRAPLGVGVCHGHQALGPVMKVTRSSGSVVHEVDGRPAWQVWVETTREEARRRGVDPERLAADDVGAYLLTYEAGIDTGSSALKIRAPLIRGDDGSLTFACGIPQGSTIRITESVPQRQVDSAREAARRARAALGGGPVAGALVFDCICRNLILGDAFQAAVRGMSEELGNVPLAGYETYGEIALAVDDMSGFHNTTTVVLAFPR